MLNSTWDDRPAEYSELRDCWLNRRRALFIAEFLREAPAGGGVVELGSGTGDLLIALAAGRPDLRFLGLEPQQSYVDFSADAASRRGLRNLAFRTGSAEEADRLMRPGERFGWILSNDVLHHVADTRAVLAAAAKLADRAAKWLAIEPNWRNPYVFLGQAFKRGERNFRPDLFLELAREEGWICRDRSYLFLIPPFVKNPPWLARRVEQELEHLPPLAGGVALTLSG